MFEPDLSAYRWGADLSAAASRSTDEVVRIARRARADLDATTADALGVELAELLRVRSDEPGRLGTLAAGSAAFAGPKTIAQVGSLLREDLEGVAWRIECGLMILERNRGPEAVIQLLLCSREARELEILKRARAMHRGYSRALGDLLQLAAADSPVADIERCLSLGFETAMVQGSRFAFRDLDSVRQTPAQNALRGVVWARYGGRTASETFIADPDGGGWLTVDLSEVRLADDDRVGVLHPAEASPELREAWGAVLGDFEATPDFAQIGRECRPAEPNFPYERIDALVDTNRLLRFALSRGWDVSPHALTQTMRGTTLTLSTALRADGGTQLESVRFRRPTVASAGVENDIVYSEALAETFEVLSRFAPETLIR